MIFQLNGVTSKFQESYMLCFSLCGNLPWWSDTELQPEDESAIELRQELHPGSLAYHAGQPKVRCSWEIPLQGGIIGVMSPFIYLLCPHNKHPNRGK